MIMDGFVIPVQTPLFLGDDVRGIVRLDNNISIEPHSSIFVDVPLPSVRSNFSDLLFEPMSSFENRCVFVATAIVTPILNKIPVNFLNMTDKYITIYKSSKLGQVRILPKSFFANSFSAIKSESVSSPETCIVNIPGNPNLADHERDKLLLFLNDFKDIFTQDSRDIGSTNLISHRIETGTNEPIKQHPYRVNQAQREVINEEISKMLDMGVVRHSSSPWSSPVVLVPKKTGGFRFCVDFRKLNAATKKDSFPLPRIDDILETLNSCTYFTTVDQAWGYWQIPLEECDKEKTAFATYNGLYEFNVLAFGLCNAPATFQRLMSLLLANLQWEICLVYLDDVLIFSRTFDEHIDRLRIVFTKLRDAGLKLRKDKCTFAQSQTTYLGYVISKNGIEPDAKKIESVQSFPRPTDVTKLKSFLGLCSYYRRYVRDFAIIAEPLHVLLRKNTKFVWNPACETAFLSLKQALCSAPVLIYPDFIKEFLLQTDASGTGIAAILAQEIDGLEHPIAFASRSLTDAERNYPVYELEALAIIYGFKQFLNT